jgi:3-methyladenine DNA glycosylase AlkD
MGNLSTLVLRKLSDIAANSEPKGKAPAEKLNIFGMEKLVFLDIPHGKLMEIADEIGMPQHELALDLWKDDSYEAKLLSCMFSEPSKITEEQADELARGLDSWVLCEYVCSKLFRKLPFAARKAIEWADSPDDIKSCAGFTLIASLAVNMPESAKEAFGFFDSALFQARKGASRDSMNVRRAITLALGMIGRRGRDWHEAAVETAEEIALQPCEAARWVASQSLAELKSTRTAKKLKE